MAAEAAISSLVELLGDQLIQKVKFLRGVKRQVELLRDELKAMQSFLIDANKKQAEDARVRDWISKIREVAQDAEDAIEMFHLKVENPRNLGILKGCTSFPKRMYHLLGIGDEIESIRARLDGIDKIRERYGIRDLGEVAESGWRSQVESLRRLCPWQNDEQVVGIQDDVKKLLRESILAEEKKGLSIVVIEGMGGIGKSTLARKIYNHPDIVSDSFDCRGWVVVSSEFTLHETIKQLIFQLPGSDKEKVRELEELMKDKLFVQEELKQLLYKQLEGKSYLIVLDDVWETQHLESLITAFPNQQENASRLLVTTRNKDIAKYSQYVHGMKLLDTETGWELLLKKAFIDSCNGKCPEELESVGRQILEKCHGLPLAIIVVGGLLVETQTRSGWEQVLKHINSYLGRTESTVSSILELSYQNLSPQLKSCFLCLSFFKEDFTIHGKRLVKTWDAQGLIQHETRRSIDEIGRGYLNELINRSMLQIQDLTVDGRVKNCRIHDLVREVCLRKAKEEIGLEIVKQGEEGNNSSEPTHKPRHRVLYGKDLETCSSNQNKHIRSLLLLNVQGGMDFVTTPSNYWKSYQLLKTLELDGFAFVRLPSSFRLLVGLKCLRIHEFGLTFAFSLELPSWLDHLVNLEVIDMGSWWVEFPRQVSLRMERLRHFNAVILRGPTKMDTWKNIECLKSIKHTDWMRCTSNLTSGCRLRKLGIRFSNEPVDNEELSKVRELLEKMQNLVKLHFWVDKDLLDISIAIPNHLPSLTKLKLFGMLPKCPAASIFPPNLSHLVLAVSQLHNDPMAELGKLPKLSFLKLRNYAFWGETMQVLCDSFPCLEALAIEGLGRLKSIDIEEGGMPKLKHLRIHNCPDLETTNMPKHIKISTQ